MFRPFTLLQAGKLRGGRNFSYRLHWELINADFVYNRNYAFAPGIFFKTRKADSAFLW